MSEPIRVALAKAWEQSPSFLVTLPSGTRRTSLSVLETAQIIAVFLRGLPIVLDRDLHLPGVGDEPYPDFDAIAKAVLAAGEGK